MKSVFALLFLLGACATGQQPATTREPAAPAEVLLGTYSTALVFPEGKSILSAAGKQNLNELAARAQADGRTVEEIKILAWADEEYPSRGRKKASPREVILAQERAEAVKKYLEEDLHSQLQTDSFNMAKRPGKLSEWLRAEDYAVKKAVEDMGPTATTLEDGSVSYSKASKALVIVDYQDEE